MPRFAARCLAVLVLVLPAAPALAEELPRPFPYRVASAEGTEVVTTDGGHRGEGTGRFRVVLVPEGDETWDLSGASLVGLAFTNRGGETLELDVRVVNPGGSGASGSAEARVVVEPGESLPLVVGLPLRTLGAESHPAFLKMAGWPDGRFRHWRAIDPARVARLEVRATGEVAHAFALGELAVHRPVRPELNARFPLLDRFGQLAHRDWPGKAGTEEDLRAAIADEERWAATLPARPERGRHGGWLEGPRLEATGRFRVEQVDGRWWFVDPDGLLFWSHAATGMGFAGGMQTPTRRSPEVFEHLPEASDPLVGAFRRAGRGDGRGQPTFNFGLANLARKHGEGWEPVALAREASRAARFGFNSLGAWSAPEMAGATGMPYTAMVHVLGAQAAPGVPDPFDPRTREALRRALETHPVAFRGDPRCLGVFVNNELHWTGSARALVLAVLGHSRGTTAAKQAFVDLLRERHGTLEAFNAAWGLALPSWEAIHGRLEGLAASAIPAEDASALATLLADRYYALVAEELESFDPGLLDLGSRLHVRMPEVVAAAARHVDVLSVNHYQFDPGTGFMAGLGRPILLSEFHFANLTGNNLGPGLRSAQDATQQARLYRSFVRRALADPATVGTHWFQWRDQSAAGREDGENYDIGLVDVADNPKRLLAETTAALGASLFALRHRGG